MRAMHICTSSSIHASPKMKHKQMKLIILKFIVKEIQWLRIINLPVYCRTTIDHLLWSIHFHHGLVQFELPPNWSKNKHSSQHLAYSWFASSCGCAKFFHDTYFVCFCSQPVSFCLLSSCLPSYVQCSSRTVSLCFLRTSGPCQFDSNTWEIANMSANNQSYLFMRNCLRTKC